MKHGDFPSFFVCLPGRVPQIIQSLDHDFVLKPLTWGFPPWLFRNLHMDVGQNGRPRGPQMLV